MGTDALAPLLYNLIITIRPQKCLEIGAGYTTPFILAALDELKKLRKQESASFLRKTKQLLRAFRVPISEIGADLFFDEKYDVLVTTWLLAPPALFSPSYFLEPFDPKALVVDDQSHPYGVSSLLSECVNSLHLADLLVLKKSDFRTLRRPKTNSIDFAWFDCGSADLYEAFLDKYWHAINDNGGILILHSTGNHRNIAYVILEFQNALRNRIGESFEIISLNEAHKIAQGSCTVIRKTRNFRPSFLFEDRSLLYDDLLRYLAANGLRSV